MKKHLLLLLAILLGARSGIAQTSGYQGKRYLISAGTSLSGSFLFNGGLGDSRFFKIDAQAGYILSRSATISVSFKNIRDTSPSYMQRYTYPGYTGLSTISPVNEIPYFTYTDTCQVNHYLATAEFRRFIGLGRGDFAPWGVYFGFGAGAAIGRLTGDSLYTNEVFRKPFITPIATVNFGSQMLLLKRATLDYGIQTGLPLVPYYRTGIAYDFRYLDGEPSDVINRYNQGRQVIQLMAQHQVISAYIRIGVIL